MNLIELLQGHLDQNLIGQLTNHIGADSPAQTEAAATGIISTLMAQLSKMLQLLKEPTHLSMLWIGIMMEVY